MSRFDEACWNEPNRPVAGHAIIKIMRQRSTGPVQESADLGSSNGVRVKRRT